MIIERDHGMGQISKSLFFFFCLFFFFGQIASSSLQFSWFWLEEQIMSQIRCQKGRESIKSGQKLVLNRQEEKKEFGKMVASIQTIGSKFELISKLKVYIQPDNPNQPNPNYQGWVGLN